MKIIVATDLHGSKYYTDVVIGVLKKENADKLILLGDLYYHGPRNPFPKDYAPLEVAEKLNGIKDKLIVVKGNCDSEVDETISEFPFRNSYEIVDGKHKILFTHGHKINKNALPECPDFDIVFYGHFHINEVVEKQGVLCINLASLSLPKENAEPSYAVLTPNEIIIKSLDYNILYEHKL